MKLHRVIMVEEEPRVRRAVHEQFKFLDEPWEITFCDEGSEAIAAMKKAPYDVVVTDGRSSDECIEVLSNAQDHSPETIRIAYAENVAIQEMLRSAPVAHQSIARPCDAEELRSLIVRAVELHDLLGMDGCEDLVGGQNGVPAVPEMYSMLVCLLADPNADMAQISDVVEQDVGLCTSLLRIVNSAYFGWHRQIASVSEAVIYLGTNTIRDIVLSQEAFRIFEIRSGESAEVMELVRTHSLAVARISRAILGKSQLAEEAFLAGMLHEVGLLMAVCNESTIPDVRTTRVYPKLGAYQLGLWGLPPNIVESVAYHLWPEIADVGDPFVTGALHIADYLAQRGGPDALKSWIGPRELNPECIYKLNIADQMDQWKEFARETLEQNSSHQGAVA